MSGLHADQGCRDRSGLPKALAIAQAQAQDQLDQHWTNVALACVRADQRLVHSRDLAAARRDLADATQLRENAEHKESSLVAELDQQTGRRWPRRDREAIGRCRAQLVTAHEDVASRKDVEAAARQRVIDLEQHQAARASAVNATADERRLLIDGLNLVDGALDRTRPERVLQIADDPTVAHLDLLGPVPASPTGRAVWCHQANQLERHRDLNGSDEAAWSQLVDDLDETPTLIRIAERRLPLLRPTNDPGTWCRLTELAVEISESVMSRAAERFGPEATSGIELDL